MSEYQFVGYYTELVGRWGISRKDESGEYREIEDVVKDMEDYICNMWKSGNEDEKKEMISEMRAYLKAVYAFANKYNHPKASVLKGLLEVEDDPTFVAFYIDLLPWLLM